VTPKQQRFVEEYVVDLCATQAAKRAGYSPKTAHVIGPENLEKPEIKAALASLMAERSKKTAIDAEWVLLRAQQIVERCMQVEPVYDATGSPTGEFKFDSGGAVRALQLIAKHTGGFTDRVEHSGPNGGAMQLELTTSAAREQLEAAAKRFIADKQRKASDAA
jgi:phage terminase small subunit